MEKFINPFTDFGFKKLFGEDVNKDLLIAEIAKFNLEEQLAYRDSLKYLRDLKNSMDTSYADGRTEGKKEGGKEGKKDIVIELIKDGSLSLEKITSLARMALEQAQKIATEI